MNSKLQVKINSLTIGGNSPVRVESMLKISLDKRDECLAQCERLIDCGCEMARAAFPDSKYFEDLKFLVANSKLEIMADIHFDPALAILAMEAGCKAIRINPGNMPLQKLDDVITTAKNLGVVIRIGANGGSISQKQLDEAKGNRAEALFIAVREQAELLLSKNFTNLILSAKSSSVTECVKANELIAKNYPDFPMHIGLTEAGPGDGGIVKGTACISQLLSKGIGDTLRVSLTDEPEREVKVGYEMLKALELRVKGVNLISCPTCGRRRADVMKLVKIVEPMLKNLPDGISVAVMGCEVNGPKEARHAKFGIAGTPGGALLFREGKSVGEYKFEELEEILPKFLSFVK